MPRKTTVIKRGKGSVPAGTVQDNSFANPTRDVDPLRVHLHDPSRAHMASAIGIVDAASCFVSDEVEGALQELCGVSGAISGMRLNGLIELGTYAGTYPNITIDTTSLAHINGGSIDISGKTYDFSTGLDPVGGAATSAPGTYYLYVETDIASADFENLLASTTLPDVAAEKVLIARITHDGAAYTAQTDARFFVRDLDRKISYTSRQGENVDAWSEGCFANLEAAFLWLEVYRDRGAGVTDEYKATLIVRGHHLLSKAITSNVGYGVHIVGDGESSISSVGGYTDTSLLSLTVSTSTDSNPSDGVYIEGITFKNGGATATLTDFVALSGSTKSLTFNRCSTRANSTSISLFSADEVSEQILITNCDLSGNLSNSGLVIYPAKYIVESSKMVGAITEKLFSIGAASNITLNNCNISNYLAVFENTGSFDLVVRISGCDVSNIVQFSNTNRINNLWMDSCSIVMAPTQAEFFGGVTNNLYFARITNSSFFGRSGGAASNQFCKVIAPAEITISGCKFNNFDNFLFSDAAIKLNINNSEFNTANINVSTALTAKIHDNDIFWDDTVGLGTSRLETGSVGKLSVSGNTFSQEESVQVVRILGTGEKFISNNSFIGGSTNQIDLNNCQLIGNNFNSNAGTIRATGFALASNSAQNVSSEIVGNHFESFFGGITIPQPTNITIQGNTFKSIASNDAVNATGVIYLAGGTSNVSDCAIIGNTIIESGSGTVTGSVDGELHGILVSGNSASAGISTGVIISGNTINPMAVDTKESHGIRCTGVLQGFNVSGNNIVPYTSVGSLKNTKGISFQFRGISTNIQVTGNTVQADVSTEYFKEGIYLDCSLAVQPSSLKVSGNILDNSFQNSIWVDLGTTRTGNLTGYRWDITDNTCSCTENAVAKLETTGVIRVSGNTNGGSITLQSLSISDNIVSGPNVQIFVDIEQTDTFTSSLTKIKVSGNDCIATTSDWTTANERGSIHIRQKSPGSAIAADGVCSGLQVSNNRLDFSDADFGIRLEHDGYSLWVREDWAIQGNLVENSANSVIHVVSSTPELAGVSHLKRLKISNNSLNVNGTQTIVGSIVYHNYGIGFSLGSTSVESVQISDNTITCLSDSGRINGSPINWQHAPRICEVKDIQVIGNKLFGDSGNAVAAYSSCRFSFGVGVDVSNISFLNNQCELERAFSLDIRGKTGADIENLVCSGNTSQGRHLFVFERANIGTLPPIKVINISVVGNTHLPSPTGLAEVNTSKKAVIDIDNDLITQTLSANNIIVSNNNLNARNSFTPGDPAFGGIHIFEMDAIFGVSISNNVITNITAPAVFVSCSDELIQNIDVSGNNVSFGLIETWNASREDSVITVEYADAVLTSAIATRDYSNSVSIDNNQIYDVALTTASSSGVLITKNPDVTYGADKPAGIAGVSISNNKISKIVCDKGIHLDFKDAHWMLKDISCSSNSIVAESPFPDGDPFGYEIPVEGIIFTGPTDPNVKIELENLKLDGNLIHHHATATNSNGILLTFDGNNDACFQVYGISVDNNTILTYVENTSTYGLHLKLTCAVKNLSASNNNISARFADVSPVYPSNGLLVEHAFTASNGVAFFQNDLASDGNSLYATDGGTPHTARIATKSFGDIDFSVSTNLAGTLATSVRAVKWENFAINSNQISYNSRYSRSTSVNTQYPIQNTADLCFDAVNYSGTVLAGRNISIVAVYGLSISNNTLRGDWLSNEATQHSGFLINTCPAYGRWSLNDPNPAIPNAGNASLKFVCQGWMIQGNNASGYTVRDMASGYYGYDQYYLAIAFTGPKDVANAGLLTGNVSYTSGASYVLAEGNISTIWPDIGNPAGTFNYTYTLATKTIN